MAAPTFVGAGAGVTIASGSGAVTAAGSGVAVGDLIVLQVLQDGVAASAVSYSAISGIANLAGTASSLTTLATDQPCGTLAKQHLRVGRATSTTCSVTVATTGDDLYYRLYVFRDVAAGTTLADILENGTAGTVVNGSGATAAVADTGVVTLGADRLALQFVGVDDDNPLGAFTGASGGFWAEAAAAFVTATGTDAAIQLQIGEVGASGDSYYTAGETGPSVGATTSAELFAQPITAPFTGTLASVTFKAKALGAPADDLRVEIRTNAGGVPSSTVIGTIVDVNVTGAQATYVAAVNAPVTTGTPYWIVFSRTGAIDGANSYQLQSGTSATTGKAWNVSSWVNSGNIGYKTSGSGAAGTLDGGSFTMAAADNWGVIGFALKPAATGPATVTRTAALNASGLVATVARKQAQRASVLSAVGAVASSGARVVPATERSAALTVTGLITSAGRELLPRTAALGAAGAVTVAGQVIHVRARSAALTATGLIATVGRETISRQAALSATAAITSAGRELLPRLVRVDASGQISVSGVRVVGGVTVSRSAAISATGTIATVGREQLARAAVVTAAAQIATVGRRRLQRSSVVTVTAQVTAAGEIQGALARAAQVTAAATVTASGQVKHVRQRSAALAATAAVSAVPRRVLFRSATLNAAGAVAVTPQRLLLRAAALNATAGWETIAGGPTAQFSFEAIATITVVVPWYAGAISTPTTGHIHGAYLGQIQGGSQGRIAGGTDGQLAKTGG